MKLYVPEIGDNLELTTKWQFPLYPEDRNSTLAKVKGFDLKYINKRSEWKQGEPIPEYNALDCHCWINENDVNGTIFKTLPITLPKGTVLIVDRIYIRKGAKEFSSISFFVKGMEKIATKPKSSWDRPQKRPVRFWARLSDCNNINFKLVE